MTAVLRPVSRGGADNVPALPPLPPPPPKAVDLVLHSATRRMQAAIDSDPDMDEALRRARSQRIRLFAAEEVAA